MAAGPFDAFLLVSFGGPEAPEDVMPFLENVTRGRDVPRERLEAVAEHYHHFGGVSPINDQNRALIAALEADFAANGLDLPIYWGNRNWHPMLADTVRQLAVDGRRRVLVLLTSAYSSYSGCRQYREDIAAAEALVTEELAAAAAALPDAEPEADDAYTRHVSARETGATPAPLRPPIFARIRHYFNHPGFVGPMVANTLRALAEIPEPARAGVVLLFSTHSIPMAYAYSSGPEGMAYVAQHEEVAALVAAGVGESTGVNLPWELVYQSRSGPPSIPWLEPDVGDRVEQLHAAGTPAVVVVPIGFVSDHMEVRYDLDVELRQRADALGIAYARAATVGTSPEFVAGIRDLVLERVNSLQLGERAYLGTLGPSHDVCPAGCCPNPRGPQPAIAGRS